MRWIQPTLFRTQLVRAKRIQWEEWVAHGEQPCARCKALDGKRYVQGRGPQPGTDTHPGCQCVRGPVAGRFGPSPVVRSQTAQAEQTVRRSLQRVGFIVRSCKDCE